VEVGGLYWTINPREVSQACVTDRGSWIVVPFQG